MIIRILCIFALSLSVYAQEEGEKKLLKESKAKESTDKEEKVTKMDSKSIREDSKFSALATYSPFDLWLISKFGLALSYIHSSAYTFELDYVRGTIQLPVILDDLGEITEQRASLLVRSFSDRNSFNFHYGINYYSFKMYIGNSLLDFAAGSDVGVNLVKVDTIGLNWGVGNRWQLGKFALGIDWLAIDIPVYRKSKQADFLSKASDDGRKGQINDVVDLISKIPRFAFIKLQAGITF